MRILAYVVFGLCALTFFDLATNNGRSVNYVAREVATEGKMLAFR